jgi:DNA polymerase III epsilon subunit-like protein
MFRRRRQQGGRFAVVDVETTGLYNSDRVVEVAVVTITADGRVVDEWDTLINPQRDVGPTHIHRITPSMVSAAPTFEEIAVALARRLDGARHYSGDLAIRIPPNAAPGAYRFIGVLVASGTDAVLQVARSEAVTVR